MCYIDALLKYSRLVHIFFLFSLHSKIKKVPVYYINENDLKSKFEKIAGFCYASNTSRKGIDALKKKLIEITLNLKYMNEAIPVIHLDVLFTFSLIFF